MVRFAGIGLFGLVAIALWIYCILDVISSEESLVRNLPKTLWLMVVIFVPTVGSIAWLAVGRPLYAGFLPGDTRTRSRPRPRPSRPVARGPEDDPDFRPQRRVEPPAGPAPDPAQSEAVRERRMQEREAELERRERLLEQREQPRPEPDADPEQTGETA